MKKNLRKTAYTLAISTLLLAVTGGVFGLSETLTPISASADGEPTQTAFVSPDSYEEYLPLNAPTSVAVSAEYTAIADGNLIYLYDRAQGEYKTYSHEELGNPQTVKNLQFCENGNLYYAVDTSGNNFYSLHPETFERNKIDDIACEKFVINGTDLYFASAVGTLYSVSLKGNHTPEKLKLSSPDEPENSNEFEFIPQEPLLAFWNGELYFTDNALMQTLYKVNPAQAQFVPVSTIGTRAQYMTINAGVLAYTTSAGDFYAYSLPNITENSLLTHVERADFTTLYSFGDYIYATQKARGTVKEYSVTDKTFTDYEISSNSVSKHRLNGATDLFLEKGVLYIADNGNARISRYIPETGEFIDPISLSMQAQYLVSDGNTLLVANGSMAQLYDLTSVPAPTLLQTFPNFNGTIQGVASVYGRYYLATNGYAYCVARQTETEEWKLLETQKGCTSFASPHLLTADVYGDLYLATGNFVYRFTETEFMQADKDGKEICNEFPSSATKLVIDYERNLYALCDNEVYRFGNAKTVFDFSQPKVYTQNVTVNSLHFGVEENAVYLLCDGNYILCETSLALPTVKNVAVNGADEEIFNENSANIVLLKTAKNALAVRFDMEKLQNSEVFPYLSYARNTEEQTALKIGQTGNYAILAVFNETEHAYFTYLMQEEFCTPLPQDEYQTSFSESERFTGYLTNGLPLYKFPYLTSLLTAGELQRGAQVTVLGEIGQLDHDYYLVEYTQENGTVKTGYVPKSYITPFDGTPPKVETVVHGNTESDSDTLWRLGYILLGFGAIAILTDWLILRKKDNEEI